MNDQDIGRIDWSDSVPNVRIDSRAINRNHNRNSSKDNGVKLAIRDVTVVSIAILLGFLLETALFAPAI